MPFDPGFHNLTTNLVRNLEKGAFARLIFALYAIIVLQMLTDIILLMGK